MSLTKKPTHVADSFWSKLLEHRQDFSSMDLKQMFKQDPHRAEKFSLQSDKLYIDFSKQHISDDTLALLIAMAENSGLDAGINKLFSGASINGTENNAAMHMALRAPADKPNLIDDQNVTAWVHDELHHMQTYVESLHAGNVSGYSGKPIETIINIGIGGSDLGPRLATAALEDFSVSDIAIHFVSNVDDRDISSALVQSNPESTLFIISSKSFSTRETLLNAETAISWLRKNGCNNVKKHLVAVTANHDAAKAFGVSDENIFHIWKWVGGRYSLWSAIGLPIAIRIGMDNFHELLNGAYAMDQHFLNQPLASNLPVILALIDVWNINFFDSETLAIFPYDHSLSMLPAYIGQLFMESNGKQNDIEDNTIEYNTSPVIWGGIGTNSQHAYFQLLHQGTRLAPIDFIISVNRDSENKKHRRELLANCFAQSEALMNGNAGQSHPAHKNIPGNHPSTTILLDELSPVALGSLLCMYEHRCFVQGHLWNINSFDQWGVELGKSLSKQISAELEDSTLKTDHDSSTNRLIAYCRDKNKSSQTD